MMRVVSGALIRGGKVLMGLRKPSGYRPNLWELPGGKVDPGETPTQALAREWFEECGVRVEVGSFISVATLHLDVTFAIELYEVRTLGGNPAALDHQRLIWVEPLGAIKFLPCSPAFYLHFPQLRARVDGTRDMSSCDCVGDSGCVNERCTQCHPDHTMPCEMCGQARCRTACPACDKCDHEHP